MLWKTLANGVPEKEGRTKRLRRRPRTGVMKVNPILNIFNM